MGSVTPTLNTDCFCKGDDADDQMALTRLDLQIQDLHRQVSDLQNALENEKIIFDNRMAHLNSKIDHKYDQICEQMMRLNENMETKLTMAEMRLSRN